MSSVRVLVVDDSLTVRKHLAEVLSSDPEIVVVGEAGDGKTAIELCQKLRPDVVTLDMVLPVMTGLAVTEYVMAYCPTPILIVSSSINRGALFNTYDALAAGALDVLDKPSGRESTEAWNKRFIAAVKTAARIRVITHPRVRLGRYGRAHRAAGSSWPASERRFRLVAIGASTGGPGALLTLLSGLPAHFPLPILVLVHMNEPFARSFADWLGGLVPFPVRYAEHDTPLPEPGRGVVLAAPPGVHLIVESGRLRLWDGDERHSCRPSIDVLFESLARELGERTLACLLTGMGRDGAAGLLALRQAGAHTIAQDEATSVIFGMPAEAIRLGAARQVLPIDRIAGAIVERIERATGEERRS
ncbi:MAG TPA: chemotaxis-specific protein-glutamate methyltransferase CheB [Polyangiaceae bacterium]|nr:chemotaxis-specific protein-glutamate methyltransferase CheB [Polyangiaceae bacterium]